jgi:hypothetical protein
MAPKGVYAFYNQCVRDPLPPHNMLFKIGGGIIPDRFKSAQDKEGTYLPAPYEILIAKVTGEDWREHETRLQTTFAAHSVTYKLGSGLGTEWFRNLTYDMIKSEMDKLPGDYYSQTITVDDFHKKSNSDQYSAIRRQNVLLGLRERCEYESSLPNREIFIRDPAKHFENWTTWSHFLGVDTSTFPQTKTEWVNRCKEMGIKTWADYQKINSPNLPKNPGDMYLDYTNWNEAFNVPEDIYTY